MSDELIQKALAGEISIDDWAESDSFATGTSTIYLVALPVHLDPG